MYQFIFIGISVLCIVSCQNQPLLVSDAVTENKAILTSLPVFEQNKTNTDEFVEFFSNDSSIGLAGKNKVEVSNLKKSDGNYLNNNIAIIKFYSLDKNKEWRLRQTFEFEKDDMLYCDPKIKDFNNDGFKDITYVSTVAARGSNEVKRLFIYDKKKDELVYIKNSEDYPNMLYNKDLDCIDSWAFHSGTTTSFLRIEGDLLKTFATVNTGGTDYGVFERIIEVIDKNGKEKLLRKDKITEDDIYVRYKNYNPPIPYQSNDFEN